MLKQKYYQKILELQKKPSQIRNIAFIAHVDHGKTTLADSLLAANQIISQKQVGELRYLDSREDEQERLITMKSSSIALYYQEDNQEEYLINLMDSPGHIEFSSEVAYSLRLADGAILLIDVLEGISSQTYTVLRQAINENITIILGLNKIDRIINELQLTPEEGYDHIRKIIEEINGFISSQLQEKYWEQSQEIEDPEKKEKFFEEMDQKFQFFPEKGNVIFCSATDGWAFTLETFAALFSKKLKLKQQKLQQLLWGQYYINLKTKQVATKPMVKKQDPMIVDFIFNNIWKVYQKIFNDNFNTTIFEKLSSALGIQITQAKTLKSQKQHLVYLMSQWLPISKCINKAIVKIIPNPIIGQQLRIEQICKKLIKIKIDEHTDDPVLQEQQLIKKNILECNQSENAPTVIYISKMYSTKESYVFERQSQNQQIMTYHQNNNNKFYGFARIFSGTLKKDQDVYIIQEKKIDQHSENTKLNLNKNLSKHQNYTMELVNIKNIYIMMGQYLDGISQIYAGNIFSIGNLDDIVFKTATISTLPSCPSFSHMDLGAKDLLKVSIYPKNLQEYPILIGGLKKLNKSDPAISIYTQEQGDIVLSTCGEVHLEKCLKDLTELFAPIEIQISEPLVAFKETITYKSITKQNNAELIAQIKQQLEQDKKKQLQAQIKQQNEADEEADQKKVVQEDAIIIDVNKDVYEEMDLEEKRVLLKKQEKNSKYIIKEKNQNKIIEKNKGKLFKTSLLNILDIENKTNINEKLLPNKKIKFRIRAIALNFELSQWIQHEKSWIKKLILSPEKLDYKQLKKNYELFKNKIKEFYTHKKLLTQIYDSLVALGPSGYGSNFLLIKGIRKEDTLFYRLEQVLKEKYMTEAQKMTLEKKVDQQQSQEQTPIDETITENVEINYQKKNEETDPIKKKQIVVEYLQKNYNVSEQEIISSIIGGFEMVAKKGPLCDEPLMGACFILESYELSEELQLQQNVKENLMEKFDLEEDKQSGIDKKKGEQITEENKAIKDETKVEENIEQTEVQSSQVENNQTEEQKNDVTKTTKETQIKEKKSQSESQDQPNSENQNSAIKKLGIAIDPYGPILGQVISTVKESCLEAFQGSNPRLVESVYLCTIQTNSQFYGRVYDILNKRQAIILNEEISENNSLYQIKSNLPIRKSFGFYKEILDETQGRIHAQLEFDTWRIIDIDPFYVPKTLEELEEQGEYLSSLPNVAKTEIENIRKRKGLSTNQKIVVNAEKQRNLTKMK